jgi:hypothetical protein
MEARQSYEPSSKKAAEDCRAPKFQAIFHLKENHYLLTELAPKGLAEGWRC